jgi:hypothetical protein
MLINSTERLNFGEMRRVTSDVEAGGVEEQLAVFTTLDMIDKLSKAERIEVQIGPAEFEFTKREIGDLRDFLLKIR